MTGECHIAGCERKPVAFSLEFHEYCVDHLTREDWPFSYIIKAALKLGMLPK